MLKQFKGRRVAHRHIQPPSGGCVLKPKLYLHANHAVSHQPPSGGCVLKPTVIDCAYAAMSPAAFRRLCVETMTDYYVKQCGDQPPSGGCVLKQAA